MAASPPPLAPPPLGRRLRRFVPFPKRKTLQRWFPPFHVRNTVHLLKERGITLVLDVGANTGQYARKLRAAGFSGRIVSFEPQPAAWEEAARHAAGDPSWEMAPPMALGREAGELALNLTDDTSLASFLAPAGGATFAGFRVGGTATVPVRRLDDVAGDHIRADDTVLLKIDVQGFENEVLAGAPETLARAEGVHAELALRPLYRGEIYHADLTATLRAAGFALAFVAPVGNRRKLGPWKQFDGLFFREPWLADWPPGEGYRGA